MKQTQLKVAGASAIISLLTAFAAIAQEPICYQETATGQIIDLTALCTKNETEAIAVSNLSLEVPDEEFLSARVKATVTNRSGKPIQVEAVIVQISHTGRAIAKVPLSINQTLNPGQSILASGLFSKDELQRQDPKELKVSFQGWQ